MKLIGRFFVLLLLNLVIVKVQAIHIKGGWMYYEYQGKDASGNNLYRIVVKVYRDCAPPNTNQNDTEINIRIFRSNNSIVADVSAPRSNFYNLQKSSFSECINPRPQVCYVILEYTGTVALPPAVGGYTASFQRCCRINGIVNISQPSNSYGNTYTITLPGSETGTGVQNNSPKFIEKDTVAVCYNSPIELDYSAVDPDGDSLVYSFTNALLGASQGSPTPRDAFPPPYSSLPYITPYSALQPFGTGVIINPVTGIIKGMSPAATGEYVLAVTVKEYRNGTFLAETRKELHVNVAACSIAGAELPIRIMSCDGYTVEFQNLSTSPAINSYYWDFGETTLSSDTSTLPRPSYTYSDTGIFTAKLVVNKNSSCSDSATTEVRVFPGFFPEFAFSGSCFSNPFVFTDLSTTRFGVISKWRWSFGDPASLADTSITKNPQFLYPSPGTYTALLEVASNKGCMDTITKEISVLDRPLLDLPFRDTLICSIDSLLLSAVGIGNFSWSPTTRMINNTTATPTVFPLRTTTYTVSLDDRGCLASDTVRVNVLDFITVDAGNDSTICLTDGITLQPVSQALGFSWSPVTGLSDPLSKNPVVTPLNRTNTYTVLANLGKCQATDSVTIRTVPYPISYAGEDTAICFSDTAMLRGAAPAGSSYAWSPAGSVLDSRSLNTAAFPLTTTTYVLSVLENFGCPKPGTDSVIVRVVPPLNVFAGNDTTVVVGQPLQLNGITNGTIFNWTPNIGLNKDDIINPVIVLGPNSIPGGADEIRYLFQVATPEGCVTEDDIVVTLFKTPPSIFVPNAFTPNNDGKNDRIRPILAGIRELIYFRIYNRYGQLIFESKQEGRGWDGRIKGEVQNTNGFVYSCEAIDYNGNTIKQNGSFVLIK